MIPKEIMSYKQQIKIKQQEIVVKLKIIKFAKKENVPIIQLANAFSCHRNTIANILKKFDENISDEDKKILLNSKESLTQKDLERYDNILNKKRIPKTNKRSAKKEDEEFVVSLFKDKKIRVGTKRMCVTLKRGYEGSSVSNLTESQLRGIYKRNNFSIKKVRTCNGERRSLYDYENISCFERFHYDVKYVLDKKALPQEIYGTLSGKDIPKYEWNIIDVASRMRWIAYSYNINAEFGHRFLMFVIQYIRASLPMFDRKIIIGMDNGSEFCSGSKRKEDEFNNLLKLVNAEIYTYNPNFDIRKNLIERSHRSDDEEFFVPCGHKMTNKKEFLDEARKYLFYWNAKRPHSGKGMNNQTPYEKMAKSKIFGIEKLLDFPTILLDDFINPIRKSQGIIECENILKENAHLYEDRNKNMKKIHDIEDYLRYVIGVEYAQNVLTYYHLLL